jgi:hypothetical protein
LVVEYDVEVRDFFEILSEPGLTDLTDFWDYLGGMVSSAGRLRHMSMLEQVVY